jgi:hypothetical protein
LQDERREEIEFHRNIRDYSTSSAGMFLRHFLIYS